MSAPLEIVELVERFVRNEDDYLRPGYNETQARREFIDPLFRALGWDMDNHAGYAEAYKDVVHEDSLEVEGATKAPDYSFRIAGARKFFVEAKAPHVNVESGGSARDAAFQIRRYAWSADLPLSILTNFRTMAVYDCRREPSPDAGPAIERIALHHCADYEADWDDIKGIFAKESILLGSFDSYATTTRARRGTLQVNAAFLREIEKWRADLAADLARRNRSLTTRELNFAVQAIVDRIVFLRICEDRSLETYEELRSVAEGPGIYERLFDLFRRADARYNSGIFHFEDEPGRGEPDRLTPSLIVSDAVLRDIITGLYYPSPFQFSVITADILGQVYEQFLGKVISVDGRRRATVEDKPEVARAGGVYYTPSYVVNFIVQHTLGPGLDGRSPDEFALGGKRRKRFRVVDPACGSGSFLIAAYQFLLDWYLVGYAQDAERWIRGRSARIQQGPSGDWRLTTVERRRILIEHIFGVDIDPQAVEVTKLSLLLKVLEGETEQTIAHQFRLFHERALPDLDKNIRCGNSLVAPDVYDNLQMIMLDDDDRARINVFDWDSEFSDAFAGGGFDVVIGNPPYVYRNATEDLLRTYYEDRYSTVQGNYDLYKFFLERGQQLLKGGGRLGYIVSASFLVQPTFSRVREMLLSAGSIEHLAPLGPGVFIRAAVDACIIVLRRDEPSDEWAIDVRAPAIPALLGATPAYSIRQARFQSNPDAAFDYRLTEEGAAILNRLFSSFPTIEHGFEFGVGINTGFVRDEITSDRRVDHRWHRMVPGTGISRYGPIRTSGWIMYDPTFIRSKGSRGRSLPQERFLSDDKILIVRTRNLALARRVVATIDTTQAYNLNRLSNIIARPNHDLRGLLGILSSRLFDWLFSTRFYDYEIKPVYLRQCPLADDSDAALTSAVGDMLSRVAALDASRTSAERDRLQREIDALDRRIDRIVYALYGVTDSEVALIEEQMRLAFAFGREDGEERSPDLANR